MDDRDRYYHHPDYGVLIGFLRGERPDWQGRWLCDIQRWDHARLEQDHHYIQWMFPLIAESQAVEAPRLRPFEVDALRHDRDVHGVLIASFRTMLGFFGFCLHHSGAAVVIEPARNFEERADVWMTPGNHNYRRISRILGTLALAGLDAESSAFLGVLSDLRTAPAGRRRIDAVSMSYWRQRASQR